MPMQMPPERFDALVAAALDEIPDELVSLVENVAVLVHDAPPEGEPADLLGLYDGFAMTDRDSDRFGHEPARILIFREPLLAYCDTEEQLLEEVRVTVVHEVAHHFGISDERLHELGYE